MTHTDNKSLVERAEKVASAVYLACDEVVAKDISTTILGLIAALQNQQPNVQPMNTDKTSVQKPQENKQSVNHEMLEAAKALLDGLDKSPHILRARIAYEEHALQQAIAFAESSKPDHIADVGKMVDPRDAIIQKLKEGMYEINRIVAGVRQGIIKPTCGIYEIVVSETLAAVKQMEGNND